MRPWLFFALVALWPTLPVEAADATKYRWYGCNRVPGYAAGEPVAEWLTPYENGKQTVCLKNISSRPIKITRFEVYNCLNLAAGLCAGHDDGPRIPPGKAVAMADIRGDESGRRWSFKYRFRWEYADSEAR